MQEAVEEGRPYAVAFVDMRMPPGWDGLETIEMLWEADPELQVVICSAYSDYEWSEIVERLGHTDQLLILRKPFDAIEVRQLCCSLTAKWNLARETRDRIVELEALSSRLQREITLRGEVEDKLRHDALHDTLTNLPNRTLLANRIEHCLLRKKSDPSYHFAVVFIDLDDFKVVNDSLGHQAGDNLLIEVAHRLVASVRATDVTSRAGNSTTARLGGDEFVILLDGLREPGDTEFVCQRLLEVLTHPVEVEGHRVCPQASMGIANGDARYESGEEVLRDADTALYAAKKKGKNSFLQFDANMHNAAMSRLRVGSALREAIEQEQLFLQYQPVIKLETGQIRCFEALVRWRHPKLGVVSPADFIPVAEETGLILPLGDWVLRTACRQLAEWANRSNKGRDISISVNFSSRQVESPGFIDLVESTIADSGIGQSRLNLELTETVVMDTMGSAASTLMKMHERGYSIHMDDFGDGLLVTQLPQPASDLGAQDRQVVRQRDAEEQGVRGDRRRRSRTGACPRIACHRRGHRERRPAHALAGPWMPRGSGVLLLQALGCGRS